jgi:hypothetical protein
MYSSWDGSWVENWSGFAGFNNAGLGLTVMGIEPEVVGVKCSPFKIINYMKIAYATRHFIILKGNLFCHKAGY